MFFPQYRKLKKYYEKGYIVPLAISLKYPQDPFHIFQLFYPKPYSFFLDSVGYHQRTGLFSYIGAEPFLIFKYKAKQVILQEQGKIQVEYIDPISKLRNIFHKYKGCKWEELAHFTGGAVGYFGYGLSRQFEKLPNKAKDDLKLPDIFLVFVKDLLVFNRESKELRLITNIFPHPQGRFGDLYTEAKSRLLKLRCLLNLKAPPLPNGQIKISHFKSNFSQQEFAKIVLKAKEYIKAGDIYQANLSHRFSFIFQGEPLKLYENLRKINPSPFASFFNLGALKIVSSSPERLIKLNGRQCETRPIAGTRPRGKTFQETRRLSRELILNEKERAEHIMLVDLERNDLGRVCDYHTVRVDEMMILEKYSHVIHIVSNVVGKLKKDKDRFDLLKAIFPGGTITGCPKIRCMEIIDELEPVARGIYTGSIGHLDFNGDMDLNIVIRTLLLKENRGYIQVGSGIVYDSQPKFEYQETLHKAQALLEALKG